MKFRTARLVMLMVSLACSKTNVDELVPTTSGSVKSPVVGDLAPPAPSAKQDAPSAKRTDSELVVKSGDGKEVRVEQGKVSAGGVEVKRDGTGVSAGGVKVGSDGKVTLPSR